MNRNENTMRTKLLLFLAIGALIICLSVSGTSVNAEDMTHTLTMAVTGSGVTTPAVGDHSCSDNQVVDITATPADGWQFDNWTGDVLDPISPATTVTMTDNKTVTANFSQIACTLTINTTGSGSVGKSPDQATYHWGDNVTLTATADAGWTFDSFSGDTTTNSIIMDGNKVVNALFTQDEYTLTTAVTGNGVTTPEVGDHIYHHGDVVDITATPADGWYFVGWTGDVANPTSATTSIAVNGNKTVTANFSQIAYTLTINMTGSGSVGKSPDQATYHWGDVVTLTPAADAGWSFDSFSGDTTANSITMDGNKVVGALFTQNEYTLTMALTGSGVTTPEVGDHICHYGDVVDITATPADGWYFVGWTGDVADPTLATTSVAVNGNKTVTANFSAPPIVECKWEQEPVADLESGDPTHIVEFGQFNPPLVKCATKSIDYYAVATDAEGSDSVYEVFSYVYYPLNSPSPYRDALHPDNISARFMYKIVYTRIDDMEVSADLVDAAYAAGLITLASGYTIDDLTGENGEITNGTAKLWRGTAVIEYDQPGGDYWVYVRAVDDDNNRSTQLGGYFNYVPTCGIEVDFTGVVYGSANLGVARLLAGDHTWGIGPAGEGQTNQATVRNIGNTWAHVTILQDDMSFGFAGSEGTALVDSSPLGAASTWKVNFAVCLGSDDAFKLYYDPGAVVTTHNFLGLSTLDELDLSILVKNGNSGAHNGTITIGSTIEPFGVDGAGNANGPVGVADPCGA